MERGNLVHLECELGRGGFDSERVYRIKRSGAPELVGLAPVHYCWTASGDRLPDGVPQRKTTINGLVAGRVMANGGNIAKVELPDGQMITVVASSVCKRPVEPYPHVPV